MNTDMVIKAMDRIESLLAAAENKLIAQSLSDVVHEVNNARQIAGAVKVLIDE